MAVGDDRRGSAVGLGVAPGVGELRDRDGPVFGAELIGGAAIDGVHHAREVLDGLTPQPELARVGAPAVQDRGGLEPDQACAAASEALVAAEGQRLGAAVGGAIAALDRVDADRVGHAQRSGVLRRCEGRQIGGVGESEAEFVELRLDLLPAIVGELLMLRWHPDVHERCSRRSADMLAMRKRSEGRASQRRPCPGGRVARRILRRSSRRSSGRKGARDRD